MEATLVSCNIKTTDSGKKWIVWPQCNIPLENPAFMWMQMCTKPFAQTLFQIKHNPHGSGTA